MVKKMFANTEHVSQLKSIKCGKKEDSDDGGSTFSIGQDEMEKCNVPLVSKVQRPQQIRKIPKHLRDFEDK